MKAPIRAGRKSHVVLLKDAAFRIKIPEAFTNREAS
jgi:hypothetical protein